MDFFKTILISYSNANVSIYLVNGEAVRNELDVDFTQGDNDAHNPDMVPPGEVWIDADQSGSEFRSNMIHELHERRLMITQDMTYEQAHEEAKKSEIYARRHPDELEDLVQAELKLAPASAKAEKEVVLWQKT